MVHRIIASSHHDSAYNSSRMEAPEGVYGGIGLEAVHYALRALGREGVVAQGHRPEARVERQRLA